MCLIRLIKHILGEFRKYDYGPVGNVIEYNQTEPPCYNLSNIKTPLYLFYAKNDILNSEKDVLHLSTFLKNTQKFYINDDEFNHMDFLYAVDAPRIVFHQVIALLEKL